MKNIIRNVLFGIAWGCTFFVIMGIIFATKDVDASMFSGKEYIKQALCAMVVGVGFSLPALIYNNEKMAKGLQVLIHMGTGLVIYFVVAFYAKWIPVEQGISITIFTVLTAIILAFVIWFCFYMHYKNQAKEMNQKIREKQN